MAGDFIVTSLFALYSTNGVSHCLAIDLLNIFLYRRLNILLFRTVPCCANGNEMI